MWEARYLGLARQAWAELSHYSRAEHEKEAPGTVGSTQTQSFYPYCTNEKTRLPKA